MNIHIQRQTTCLKINNVYNKLHEPEWVKKLKPAFDT